MPRRFTREPLSPSAGNEFTRCCPPAPYRLPGSGIAIANTSCVRGHRSARPKALRSGRAKRGPAKKLNTDVFPERLVIGRRWADPPIESEGV